MNVTRLVRAAGSMLIIGLVCSPCWARVQPIWVQVWKAGLAHETNEVLGISLDTQGNVVVGGSSTGAAGDWDYLLLKYEPSGSLLWSSRYASLSNGNDQARSMALDHDGHVYLTGTSTTVKYSSSGAVEWAIPFAGRGLVVGDDGQIYVTGFSESDFATAKFTPDASNVWVRIKDVYGLAERSEKVTLDETGNIYVAGGGQFLCANRTCYWKFLVVKYDADGNTLWVSAFPDAPYVVTFVSMNSLVELSGSIYLSAKSDLPLDASFYTARLDSHGSVDWAQDFGIGAMPFRNSTSFRGKRPGFRCEMRLAPSHFSTISWDFLIPVQGITRICGLSVARSGSRDGVNSA